MIRLLFTLVILLTSFSVLYSQEVLCNIRVMPKNDLPISDRQKLQTLQKSAREFINNRKWTNEVFKDEERIEFNLSFNILEKVSTDRYAGTLQVQFSRPVFNSSYYSPLLNYLDKEIEFDITPTVKYVKETYNNLLKDGVAPEMARMILPQNMMTEWFWSGSLYAFARVCNLRNKEDAQEETRMVTHHISRHLKDHFPLSAKYLLD